MANSEAGTSGDAAQAPVGEYQVFLSFRGADIRYSFSDFLYDRLVDAGVDVFRDEERFRYGDVLSEKLEYAINNSVLYIPIFSKRYAESKWCLKELKLMVDNVSNSEGQKSIFPVFFHVKTDVVKLKRSSRYEAALKKHEEKKYSNEVEGWREALQSVGEHSGCVIKKDQSQAAYVKLIVNRVLEMLEIKQKLGVEHLVGLANRVKYLTELLDASYRDVRLLVIYGIGGIGKTTIAKEVFNQLSSNFGKRCSFLKDVRENSSTKEGIVQLQKRLLCDIVDSKCAEDVKDDEDGIRTIERTLRTEKVLVGLDDVHDKELIKILIGCSSLCPGSRIIITTRNMDILKVEGIGEIHEYDMPKMNETHALELFCRHAFGTKFPTDDFDGRSREIVQRMRGHPLTIKVIGSLLKGEEDKDFWKETLKKLSEVPEKKILEVLRISYDDLEEYQQNIFLDIACFFVNEKKTHAIHMWTEVYPIRAIKVLTKRCLIKIMDHDRFWMHDEIIELGRHIVHEESRGDPRNQTRLWNAEEALKIIKTGERNDKVEALVIDGLDDSFEITNKEFERLPNLKFLKLCNGTFSGNFEQCCSKLKWISWHPRPLQDFRVENMYLDHLVVFKLDRNFFEDDSKAWDLIKKARNLKVLSLTDCRGITKIPIFSQCLIDLEIEECRSLTNIPEDVEALAKLERLSLDRYSTKSRKLPNSIVELKSLRILRFPRPLFSWNHVDWELPSGIYMLTNLEELDLSGHSELGGEILDGIGELSSLKILNLEDTNIHRISPKISGLRHLHTLNLNSCSRISELPELPTSLTCLVLKSEGLLSVPNLSNLTNLVELKLSDNFGGTRKSTLNAGCNLSWIWRLSRLKKLDLILQNVPVPRELASLSHLEKLYLSGLDMKILELPSSLTSLTLESISIRWAGLLPSSLRLRNLSTLVVLHSEVEEIPLDGLPRLEKIVVAQCRRLKRLSIPSKLRKLHEAEMSNCPELVEIQVVGLLKPLNSLGSLWVHRCQSLRRIGGLSYMKDLECLFITKCHALTNVEGLNELESLRKLEVHDCPSLTRLIDASCTNIPDDCFIHIEGCGGFIKQHWRSSLKSYREAILRHPLNKRIDPFTIIFVFDGLWDGFAGGVERENENATRGLVTYEELIADVKGFGFHLERMWHRAFGKDMLIEIKNDEEMNGMMFQKFAGGFADLYVEGRFDSELSNAECSEATANKTQKGHDGNINGGKIMSMENRKKDKDVIGELADQNEVVRSSCHGDGGVEHDERSCEATAEVEEQRDLSPINYPSRIIFVLGVKKYSVGHRSIGSVTCGGLIADVNAFGFHLERMWYGTVDEDDIFITEIKSDKEVNEMVWLASRRGLVHLYLEGKFDSEPSNAKCSEAAANRMQMRDGRMGRNGNVDGQKMASMENRKKDKDVIGELAYQNEVQRGEGVEHDESFCQAIAEVEEQRNLSFINHFTIIFVLGVKKYDKGYGFIGGVERENENATLDSVTCEKLIADVNGFGFHLERMWYKAPGKDGISLIEIKSDEEVNGMVPLASERGFVHLYVEGKFDSEPSIAECFKATENGMQMGHNGNVDGGEMVSMENRKKDKDEIGEPVDQNEVVQSSCQRGEGVEHNESSCQVIAEVEEQRDFSSGIYEGDQETENVPANRDVGGAPGVASSSRTGTASSSRNGAAFSSGRGRGSSSRKRKLRVIGSSMGGFQTCNLEPTLLKPVLNFWNLESTLFATKPIVEPTLFFQSSSRVYSRKTMSFLPRLKFLVYTRRATSMQPKLEVRTSWRREINTTVHPLSLSSTIQHHPIKW